MTDRETLEAMVADIARYGFNNEEVNAIRSLLEENERLLRQNAYVQIVHGAPPLKESIEAQEHVLLVARHLDLMNENQRHKDCMEAALILLPEQPEAAMNALRGDE